MRRLAIGAVVLAMALALLNALGVFVLPYGSFTQTEICERCGMTRATSGNWAVSGDWIWRTREGPAEATPASEFLAKLDCPACAQHLWRFYWGVRGRSGLILQTRAGPFPAAIRIAHMELPEEEALADLDTDLAVQALRYRLERPSLDGQAPPWFSARGWPPADAGEARAWWAGVKRRW